ARASRDARCRPPEQISSRDDCRWSERQHERQHHQTGELRQHDDRKRVGALRCEAAQEIRSAVTGGGDECQDQEHAASITRPDMTMLSRRDFIASSAATVAAVSATGYGAQAAQQTPAGTRTLLKGGCVISLDPKIGDFPVADVLIDGG